MHQRRSYESLELGVSSNKWKMVYLNQHLGHSPFVVMPDPNKKQLLLMGL